MDILYYYITIILFQYDRLQIESGQTVRDGGTDYAAADNCYIIHRKSTSSNNYCSAITNLFYHIPVCFAIRK